jgi:hypothetical protein
MEAMFLTVMQAAAAYCAHLSSLHGDSPASCAGRENPGSQGAGGQQQTTRKRRRACRRASVRATLVCTDLMAMRCCSPRAACNQADSMSASPDCQIARFPGVRLIRYPSDRACGARAQVEAHDEQRAEKAAEGGRRREGGRLDACSAEVILLSSWCQMSTCAAQCSARVMNVTWPLRREHLSCCIEARPP